MASKGLTFDPYVVEDYVSVNKGGLIDNNTWLGRFDFVSELDLEKAGRSKQVFGIIAMMYTMFPLLIAAAILLCTTTIMGHML